MTSLNFRQNKNYFVWMIILFLLVLTTGTALAGDGDGSGGGSGEPLALLSSYPSDGEKDVPLPVEIKFGFSKNVINMSVKENNIKCFSMWTDEGKPVPVEVRMGDDQIQPELKREVVLVPQEELAPGSAYTVIISEALCSKSGVTLAGDVEIKFVTAGVKEVSESTMSESVSTEKDEKNSVSKDTENTTVNVQPDSPKQDPRDKAEDFSEENENGESEQVEIQNNSPQPVNTENNSAAPEETVPVSQEDSQTAGGFPGLSGILTVLVFLVVIAAGLSYIYKIRKTR